MIVPRAPLSLLFMDVDNFKRVVDSFGHLKGSQVLCEIATTLGEHIQAPAFGVAYAGDEFVVVLPDMTKRTAFQTADDIRRWVNETRYLVTHGHNIQVSLSMGLASFTEDAEDMRELLALADNALFQVKSRGKNRVLAWG